MKQSRLAGALFYAALALFLFSCGGGESNKESSTEATSNDTANTATVPEVNTIVTTPQTMAIITHKVADFAKWLPAYEAHDSARLANGLHNYVIGRGIEDTNMVMVALKADDAAKAKAFSKDPGLKQAMQKAGVKGAPNISIVTATWQDTSNIGAAPRSLTTFDIKDWDAWIKNFEDGKQERLDNGLAVRVVGHDADDNKKVALVTALTDTAKARAYWASDALKKRREAGGVTTEPKRFVFSIAKRY